MGKPHYAAVTLLILGTFELVFCRNEGWEKVCKEDLDEYAIKLKKFDEKFCSRRAKMALAMSRSHTTDITCEKDSVQYENALRDFNAGFCSKSVNKALYEYESLETNQASYDGDTELRKFTAAARLAWTFDFSAGLATYAGHPIFCDKDIAENVTRISRETAGYPSDPPHICKSDDDEDPCE